MRSIIHTLKTLSATSGRTQWAQMETQVLGSLNKFDREAFVEAASHFSESNQGSHEFWKEVQNQTMKNFNNFTKDDVVELAVAIGTSVENIDPKVEQKLLDGLNEIVDGEIETLKRQDPYWEADFNAYLDSGLAPIMKYAASMQATRNLDKTRYPELCSEAPGLVEFEDTYDLVTKHAANQTEVEAAQEAGVEGDAKDVDLAEDGRIVLDEELQGELKNFQSTFEKELQENAPNEKFNLWSLFKFK